MFKISFMLFISIIIISCATTSEYLPEKIEISAVSFAKYADMGFLITPEPYLGSYESLGLFTATLQPKCLKKSVKEEDFRSTSYSESWYVAVPNIYTLLDSVYNYASGIGGNGIMNFDVEFHYIYNEKAMIRVPELLVEGFIIKRIDL